MNQTMQTLNKILVLSALVLTNTTACTTMAIGGGGHSRGNMHSSAEADLINRVNRVLVNDSLVHATDINVSLRNGVVTLSGDVPSHEVADRAVHLTRSVEGVESVNSQLHISNQ